MTLGLNTFLTQKCHWDMRLLLKYDPLLELVLNDFQDINVFTNRNVLFSLLMDLDGKSRKIKME